MSVCAALLCACAQVAVQPQTATQTGEFYTVRAHDTLYSIAWRHGLDYRELAHWNRIGADYRIEVGQVLTLVPRGAPAPPAARARPGSWSWPTAPRAAPRLVPGGGILLGGQLGQDVRAASAGRVVYNGNGIRGYGNLIIIKHGENWLTAYAHNRDSTVHEGQEVAMGEVIAHMGEASPRVASLYFEIRENGRPVNPLPLLPPR